MKSVKARLTESTSEFLYAWVPRAIGAKVREGNKELFNSIKFKSSTQQFKDSKIMNGTLIKVEAPYGFKPEQYRLVSAEDTTYDSFN